MLRRTIVALFSECLYALDDGDGAGDADGVVLEIVRHTMAVVELTTEHKRKAAIVGVI